MQDEIQAVFMDVGNTLRVVVPDPAFQSRARQQLADVLGAPDPVELLERLTVRWKAYRRQAVETCTEVSEQELWTRYMLPDCPPEMIGPLSGKLMRLWRDKDGHRVMRPDVKRTVVELVDRGYCLGIIANTVTETEIPDWLVADGLAPYIPVVVLSSQVGYRKPGPEIFRQATRRAGIPPGRSAYLGDNPLRDVVGARNAGFQTVILLTDPDSFNSIGEENRPDRIIRECSELLDILPHVRERG